jgi:TldD protein
MLSTTGGVTIGALMPRRLAGLSKGRQIIRDPAVIIDGTDVRNLTRRALDAATAAGADYADIRLTRQLTQGFLGNSGFTGEDEQIGVGIRAFVKGYVGFAASPYWDPNEVVLLAREAVRQATANAQGCTPRPAWAPAPAVSGAWVTPIKTDPFLLSIEEKEDFLNGLCLSRSFRGASVLYEARFVREERALATTTGSYTTQTFYTSNGSVRMMLDNLLREQNFGYADARGLTTTALGWELFAEANIPEQLPRLYEEALADLRGGLPVKAGNVGRYDVVMDASTMANLVSSTIGAATHLDRAVGEEANANGTSYLGPDPLALLGTYQAASPLVTITANRSMDRGLGTVKWDDEGVPPDDFPLVQHGVLVDYQTTRAQATWLAPYYTKQHQPIQSHGCAASESALTITAQHTPNLVLAPGRDDIQFGDLVADTKRGLAVIGGSVQTDFQVRTGVGIGEVREISGGKLGPRVGDLGFLFETTELWKSVVGLGGANSVVQLPSADHVGEPSQQTSHSVRSVPAKMTNVPFIDLRRKA